MLKMTIDNEEVLSNNDISIKEEILSPSSTILNNVYPKSWELDKDYVSRFYYPKDYSKLNIQNFSVEPEEAGTTIQINGSATLNDVDTTKESRVLRILGQTSQTGTPTPSSPIPINVVSGDNEINICGKNLLNIETTIPKRYVSYTNGIVRTSDDWSVSDFIPIQGNTNYILSGITNSGWTAGTCFYDKDKTFISSVYTTVYSFTTPSSAKYVRLSLNSETPTNVMFEKGSTATTYEPYIGSSYPIYLGVENSWKSSKAIQGTFDNNTALASKRIVWFDKEVSNGETMTITCNNSSLRFAVSRTTMNTQSSSNTQSQNSGWQTGSYTITFNSNGYACLTISKTDDSAVAISSLNDNDFTITYNGNHISNSPIELCKIGTYQDYIYKGEGYNLYNKNANETGTISQTDGQTISPNSTIYHTPYIAVETNGTYNATCNTSGLAIRYFTYDSNHNYIGTGLMPFPWTIPSGVAYVRLQFNVSYDNDLMFFKGTSLPYEPYNAKDKWLVHKEIGKVVLDGSENWYVNNQTYRINNFGAKPFSSFSVDNVLAYSNYFKWLNGNSGTFVDGAMWYILSGNELCLQKDQNPTSTTLATFKSWLGTNKPIVYYVLATPTTTEITDTTLISQLESLSS